MSAYQDNAFKGCELEYGITDNQNFGIYLLHKENKFHERISVNQESSIFYKVRLFHDNNFVISLQPKIIINKDKGRSEDFFAEVSLLFGSSYETSKLSGFNQNILSFGHYINHKGQKKRYYNFSVSKGVKFSKGWMLVNFMKY